MHPDRNRGRAAGVRGRSRAGRLLRKALGGPPAEAAGVRLASYGLIALIGIAITAQALWRSYLRRQGAEVGHACCGHEQGGIADHRAPAGEGTRIEQGARSGRLW